MPARAVVLWSDPGGGVTHKTGPGVDILGGTLKRTDTNSDALYFKVHIDPISDVGSEPYFAGFQLFEGDNPRMGVGNALEAWGYSAFNTAERGPSNRVPGEFNFRSAHPEPSAPGKFQLYELVRHDVERTIVFKVQYIPGSDDLVTVWLNPKLGPFSTEQNQPDELTTHFKAKATFDQIRLRHGGDGVTDGGNGWIFSDMAVATSFSDFLVVHFWQTIWFNTLAALGLLFAVGGAVRFVEKRKYQLQLQRAEQESALERERARIAQDLHDDLGSSLTRISLLSGLLLSDKGNPDQLTAHVTKLSSSAVEAVRALEEIVWAVRPGSDTLQSLIEYIAHVASEMFEGGDVRCRLDLPADLPRLPLPPETRHNIFLIVKEALTNALKHSRAHEVQVRAEASAGLLQIQVQDDGAGFELDASPSARRAGNGLGNMRRRAAAIGGHLVVESARGHGSLVRLSVPLPAPVKPGRELTHAA